MQYKAEKEKYEAKVQNLWVNCDHTQSKIRIMQVTVIDSELSE